MTTGRELDALVAEKVMGWTNIGGEQSWMAGKPPAGPAEDVPPYSTDIAAAWTVVEKMRAGGWDIILDDMCSGKTWQAHFERERHEVFNVTEILTASLAICLAALKVSEVK